MHLGNQVYSNVNISSGKSELNSRCKRKIIDQENTPSIFYKERSNSRDKCQ